MFDKKEKSGMDLQTADEILQNVFKACNAEPNKVSIEKIEEKTKIDYKTDNILIIIVSVLLFVSIMLPLFFKSAQFFVSVDSGSSRSLSITGHDMTTESLKITFDGPSVDIASTYIELESGEKLVPVNYDRSDNTVTFPSLDQEANIYIYDVNGKCLHLLISPHN